MTCCSNMFKLGTMSIQINKSLIPNNKCLWLLLYVLHNGVCVSLYKYPCVYTVQLCMYEIYCVRLIAGMLYWMDTWDTGRRMNQRSIYMREKDRHMEISWCVGHVTCCRDWHYGKSQVIVWPISVYDWTKFILVWKIYCTLSMESNWQSRV